MSNSQIGDTNNIKLLRLISKQLDRLIAITGQLGTTTTTTTLP